MLSQSLLTLTLVLFPCALCALLLRLAKKQLTLSARGLLGVAALGALLALATWTLEAFVWGVTELSVEPQAAGIKGSLLAMLVFAAPLEEGAKLLAVWPLFQLRRFRHRADGLLAAVAAATGFAAVEGALYLSTTAAELPVLRGLLGAAAHLFFASLWGYVLAQRSRLHWLGGTWFLAMLFHGLFDHIVFGRGVGTLVVGALLCLAMALVMALMVRDLFTERSQQSAPPRSARLSQLTLEDLTQAMRKQEQPLMLHWIVLGAFVNTGVVFACVALSVYVGHQIGVDFAAANEGDMRSNGPLVLLGSAVMSAFPIAGYLIARASNARSVLEPAMGAAAAIAAVVLLLSMTAPVAVVFALAVAPAAFGLACGGAWFGLARVR